MERTVIVYHSCNRTVRKESRDEGVERRIETKRGKFKNYFFVPDCALYLVVVVMVMVIRIFNSQLEDPSFKSLGWQK